MCSGGRVVNYLKALLGDARHDVLFSGYQAAGTPGREIQRQGRKGGSVVLDGQTFAIKAQVHTLSGFSAHADQQDLINFISRIPAPPKQLRVVHGDDPAKASLAQRIQALNTTTEVVIP
jgi:metallo-beta-lactamase family protein